MQENADRGLDRQNMTRTVRIDSVHAIQMSSGEFASVVQDRELGSTCSLAILPAEPIKSGVETCKD